MSDIDIEAIKTSLDSEIEEAGTLAQLEELRIKYLGRKGIIAQLTSVIPTLPQEERRAFGQQVNDLKNKINSLLQDKQKTISSVPDKETSGPRIDMGMPGIVQDLGYLHPLTKVSEQICAIFTSMGFRVVEGPEIETEYNNFTGLNIPLEHPSRDAFDTFYLKTARASGEHLLLRSHTSPVQVRVMKSTRPPLAVVVPGRVYRPDAVDASHSFMFQQVEGLVVDKNIRFSDLKGVLEVFAKRVFGPDIKMRFRPHFFPFTEPSAEVDISCIICKGKGCSVCGRKGWLEILGAGMVHPSVFKAAGYDTVKYSGFAFGMGVERIAMLKYGIGDIRLFFENDLRFLRQF
ncbi:MAG: phenylalanine--tRNA ligase subunit alpha [Candidatus Omnitrophica bacterium]|nr:phenylalanine--tRNA ligase subunit alpha [Candidatus Omnitrophota bacterium]